MNIKIENVFALLRKGKGKYTVEKTNIYISGNTIAHIGDTYPECKWDKIIDGSNRLAIPGLINSHAHTYMTCLRSLADDLPFDEWLFKRVMPIEDSLSMNDAYISSLCGCAEMLKTGTTSFLEMHMFPGMVADAALKTGMRGILSRGLVGEGDNYEGKIRIKVAFEEMANYSKYGTLTFALGPHAIYTTDAAFLRKVASIAAENGMLINIHLSESPAEVENCINKTGKTPTAYLEDCGILENRVVAAHCTNVSDDDIEILKKHNVNVALNIRSNMKLGNGVPPIKKLYDAGINLCIGTDSAASNNSLNMFSEMSSVALIPKGIEKSPVCISAGDVIDMATYNAANALEINSGILAEGKNADIVLLDIMKPSFIPHNDLVSSLCYSVNGSEVDTVIVNGEISVENGMLTNINENTVYTDTIVLIKSLKERKQQ